MIYIIEFCTFPMCWLPWILSGLLGLLAGYLLWARWKSKFEEMEGKYNSMVKANTTLEADLKDCRHHRATLEGDLSTAHGMVKEMQAKVDASAAAEAAAIAANSGAGNLSTSANLGGIVSGFAAGAATGNIGSKDDEKNTSSSTKSGSSTGAYGRLKSNNLQIIEGIGPKMESVLKDAGVSNWSDLSSKTPAELRDILNGHGDKYKIINPDSWSQQAGLAASGKWDELVLLQKQLDTGTDTNIGMTDSKLEKLVSKTIKGGFGKFKENDLKIVEGVGPKIAELLNNAGINTWVELSNTSVDKIQEVLDAAGSRYKLAKPRTWPQQAGLAAAGKWDELATLQDELDGGV